MKIHPLYERVAKASSTLPDYAKPVNKFQSVRNPEKREKKRITYFLNNIPKCYAVVIENTGRKSDDGGWYYSPMIRGISDIIATIDGKAVHIELKRPGDRMSKWQKKYKEKVESANGVYIVTKGLNDFIEWFLKEFNYLLNYLDNET
jgi:hypothetical protein